MINKHFFKTVLIFSGMIILGLVAIFLAGYFDNMGGVKPSGVDQVAK